MASRTIPIRVSATTSHRGGLLDKYFYFGMSLLITAVVIYGFSHTTHHNLLDATPPRPWILWVHAAVFSSWLLFLCCPVPHSSRRWLERGWRNVVSIWKMTIRCANSPPSS